MNEIFFLGKKGGAGSAGIYAAPITPSGSFGQAQ
jgi:hypothetical protein